MIDEAITVKLLLAPFEITIYFDFYKYMIFVISLNISIYRCIEKL